MRALSADRQQDMLKRTALHRLTMAYLMVLLVHGRILGQHLLRL